MKANVHRIPNLCVRDNADNFTDCQWRGCSHNLYINNMARQVKRLADGLPYAHARIVNNMLRAYLGFIPVRKRRYYGRDTTQYVHHLRLHGTENTSYPVVGRVPAGRTGTSTSGKLIFLSDLGCISYTGLGYAQLGTRGQPNIHYLIFDNDPKVYTITAPFLVAAVYLYEEVYRYMYDTYEAQQAFKQMILKTAIPVKNARELDPVHGSTCSSNKAQGTTKPSAYFLYYVLPFLKGKEKVWANI